MSDLRAGEAAPGPEVAAPATDDPEPSGLPAPGEGAEVASGQVPSEADRRRRRRRHRVAWAVTIVVAVLVALVVRLFIVQTFWVPTGSMEPTLWPHDRMLVLKAGYSITTGAVIVFRQPPGDIWDTSGEDLVKRVIGLPGETIWSVGNTIYVDGHKLAQPWLKAGTPLGRSIPRQKIPPDDYYVLGDNRTNSLDSRWWGYVPRSYVIGRVILVFWHNGHPVFDPI